MVLATMLLPASAFVPEFAMPLGWAAVACGGVGTAKTHIRHIYRKLDVHSQQELIQIVENAEVD